jgi:hypothetical protein
MTAHNDPPLLALGDTIIRTAMAVPLLDDTPEDREAHLETIRARLHNAIDAAIDGALQEHT